MKQFIKDFRKFATQGNLLQVATAFIIGLYFKDVIDRFTNGIVLAFITAFFGKANFDELSFTVNKSKILVGTFLNAVINFLLIALVLFLMIKAWEQMRERLKLEKDDTDLTTDQELLTEIRDLLAAQQADPTKD
jgi:large conductance mechanosensitive channel